MHEHTAIEVPIHDLSHVGEGVGRYHNQTVFVPGALPGETVLARPREFHSRYLKADLVRVSRPSPERVVSGCAAFPRCGGCQLQHLAYPAQLAWKEERVSQVLTRLGGVVTPPVRPMLGAASSCGYRGKAQFPVGNLAGRLALGFYERGSHRIVPTEDCLVQHPRIRQAVAVLMRHLRDQESGLLRHVLLRASFSHPELLITFVARQPRLLRQEGLIRALQAELPGLVGVTLNINNMPGNRILGPDNVTLWGRDYLRETLQVAGKRLEFRISAPSFFQVNPIQAQVMFTVVTEYAEVGCGSKVLDAYCGTGSIALSLAAAGAGKVWGIEELAQAVADARENARHNQVNNVEFIHGLVEEKAEALLAAEGPLDVLVVDPPRAGLEQRFVERASGWGVRRWVYASCNSATLARDIRQLIALGYRLTEVQPIDMFPHTAHIECVALLEL